MKIQDMNQEQLARAIKTNRFKLIADVFLIVVILLILLFVYVNIQDIKTADNVCQVCFDKYNLTCYCYKGNLEVEFDFENEALINNLNLTK